MGSKPESKSPSNRTYEDKMRAFEVAWNGFLLRLGYKLEKAATRARLGEIPTIDRDGYAAVFIGEHPPTPPRKD